MHPGRKLRELRERLGLTLKAVVSESMKIGKLRENDEYYISFSRLSDIETKAVCPGLFRLHSFSLIYNVPYRELLQWFGINIDEITEHKFVTMPSKTHVLGKRSTPTASMVHLPVEMDPGFNLRKTTNVGRMIVQWGYVPTLFLAEMASTNFTYGYIGTEDLTMYPLLLPGSFVQVDESKNQVMEGAWKSEFERPIYFIETRNEYICSWCVLYGSQLTIQPHPLSPNKFRTMKHPQEAEVIGQVVGVAMRLDQRCDIVPNARSKTTLN